MPWFRLDDDFHSHPKVRDAGNCAVGLWVRCGTYAAHYLTDGYVAGDIAGELGSRREADRLVDAELWVPNGAGFIIPDYLEYNPSAEQVRRDRENARKRAAKWRADRGK